MQQKFLEIAMEEGGVVAEDAHDRKLTKSFEVCKKEGIHFVPLAWDGKGASNSGMPSLTSDCRLRPRPGIGGARSPSLP